MEQTLKTLQDLQMRAFKKGIHVFQVSARTYEEEEDNFRRGLVVTVFLTSSDKDEDYGAFYFYEEESFAVSNFRALYNLKAFIGEE